MSCALNARSRNVPELCMGSSLKRREKNGRIYCLILLYPVEAPSYYQYEAFGWTESTCSLEKRQHVHVQTCPPLPQPTGGCGAQRGIAL